jgi:acetyl esterase/lipase
MRRARAGIAAAIVAVAAGAARGQEPAAPPGTYKSDPVDTAHGARESLLLWPDGAPGAVGAEPQDKPKITIYRAAPGGGRGAAAVVCPGGSYARLSSDREGRQVADWLNGFGVSAFVLQYRVGPRYRHPAPLQDVQRALRLVRSRAEELGIDGQRIGLVGFSAGGHLASTAGTRFDDGRKDAADPVEREGSRPAFLVLGYPVITMTGTFAHESSRRNLLGDAPDAAVLAELSSEKHVTPSTPPTFLFHTAEDPGVPVENSLMFFSALRANGVPAALHVFQKGKHGVGLGVGDEALAMWPSLCRAWLSGLGVLGGR